MSNDYFSTTKLLLNINFNKRSHFIQNDYKKNNIQKILDLKNNLNNNKNIKNDSKVNKNINMSFKKSIKTVMDNNMININKNKKNTKSILNLIKTVVLIQEKKLSYNLFTILFLLFNLFIISNCQMKYGSGNGNSGGGNGIGESTLGLNSNKINLRLNNLNSQSNPINNGNKPNHGKFVKLHRNSQNNGGSAAHHQHQHSNQARTTEDALEKIKQDALIDVFKMKLLQLLEVDEAPSPSEINITKNPVPEPIIREYNRLLKLNQSEKNRLRSTNPNSMNGNGNSLHSTSFSRGLRDRPTSTVYNNDKYDDADFDDDNIRFNSSIVQQITLLPKKVENNGIHHKNNGKHDWCNDLTEDTNINHSHNNKQSINKLKKQNNFETKNKNRQHQTKFTTLSCFTFLLEEKEFYTYDIQSAEMYIKLDLNAINELIYSSAQKLNERYGIDIASYLYLEVNGHLIKKIDLMTIKENNNINDGNLDDNDAENNSNNNDDDSDGNDDNDDRLDTVKSNDYDLTDENNPIFDYADIKEIIEDLVQSTNSDPKQQPAAINVRLLCTNELVNMTQSKENLKYLFSKIEENVALHVKFGDLIPSKINRIRSKRQQNGNSRQRSNKQPNKQPNYRDCSELRRSGFSASNFSCCRETISFSMEQIGWSHWILSPKIIEYKYCRGGCLSGISPRFDNTQIVYKMFELSHTFESAHCCNIYDYEDDIPFIYGSPPHYNTKMVSLNAKNCLCS